MTWKEFKAAIDKEGIGDDEEIAYIDIDLCDPEDLMISRDREVNGFSVTT